jgi:hypothetical protein
MGLLVYEFIGGWVYWCSGGGQPCRFSLPRGWVNLQGLGMRVRDGTQICAGTADLKRMNLE